MQRHRKFSYQIFYTALYQCHMSSGIERTARRANATTTGKPSSHRHNSRGMPYAHQKIREDETELA